MTKNEFIKLINNAKVDENGNLYYNDDSLCIGNIYFATVTTICNDFVATYCYDKDGKAVLYDNHFTQNDDTLEINIVKELQEKNDKLQKQVDESLNRKIEPKIFHCHADASETCPKVQQAVKEFAERLKKRTILYSGINVKYEAITADIIDELLKEYIDEE